MSRRALALFVLLLLSVLAAPALAQTVSFRDERGAAATDFVVGEPLRIRVEDPSLNLDSQRFDDFFILLVNERTGSGVGANLGETGFATGTFEGVLASDLLGVLPGDLVTVTHETSTAQATMTASRTELVDAAGEPAGFYLESSRVYVRVFSPLVNNPQTVDTVAVTLTADLSGDEEPLLLNETGPDTGLFTGSFQLRLGPGLPASSALETTEDAGPPHRFDTVRAAHADGHAGSADAVGTIGSLTRFVDTAGREVASYPMGSMAVVEVEDHNYNDPGQLDTVSVNLQSVSTGDQEPLPLRETGRDTGLYRSSILLDGDFPAIPADGQLRVQVGGDIDAMHLDFLGIVASGTRAAIDFLGIQFVDEAGLPTSEVLENGTARVRVFSAGDNVDPSIAETISVEVTSLYAGDRDFVQLTETGLDTSVFEGTIELSFAPGTQGNGILETLSSGPPEYRPDELTARLGPYTGTAHTIPARLAFLDELGRETTTVPLGLPVRVRLTDHSRNDPGVLQTFQIDVQVANPNASGDGELVTLRETGFDTGVFEGQIASQAGSPQSNGRLDGALGFMIEANIFHLNDPGVIRARAVFTGSAVSFIDAAGQPTSVFLESSRAYVRVFDSFANGNPSAADSTSVEIAVELSGDRETVLLTETGANTGVFEGSIRLRFGAGQPFDGWLETTQEPGPPPTFDTLRAIYTNAGGTSTATATTLSSRILFLDAAGKGVSSYARGATVYLRVEDANVNQHPGSFDLAEVILRSQSGDVELLQLVETGRDTSLFEGSIRLSDSGSSGDGELQAAVGSEIEAEHVNPHVGSSKAYAVIDSIGIEFIDEAGRPTSEVLENGTARLRVMSADANSDPGSADTLDIDVRSRFAGDREFAPLTETGADTGIFEGTIDLNFAPGSQANGILETFNSGPPEFRPEELTARVGPYSATAHTVSARLTFIDEFGRETTAVPLGSAVRVRLVDQTRNEAQQRQSVQVDLRVVIANGGGSTSFDNETITLLETGFDTGVFEGLIDSRAGSPQGNGVLDGVTGSTIEAQVFHLNDPGSTIARAAFTGNAVVFVDVNGQPASVYLESSRVYVRVIDSFANSNPSGVEFTSLEITSDSSADRETVFLAETGANTGVFEGSIKMRFGLGVNPFNGFLETGQEQGPPHRFDTLRATYSQPSGTSTATASTTGSRTWFVDAFGTVVDSYAKDSMVYVRVEDHNFNTDPARFDTASVRLISQSPGDEEFLQLLETGKDTGLFEGSIRLASSGSGSDGRLQASVGSRIDAEHPNTGPFGIFSTAHAVIDFLSVEFIDEAGRPTSEVLENGTARLRVISADGNSDPGSADTLDVDVRSRFAGDREFARLTETGPDTGIFEGTIDLNFAPGSQANGILETLNGGPPEFRPEELTARVGPYSATAHTVSARLVFLDEFGREITAVPLGSAVRVRLADQTRNDPQARQSVQTDIRVVIANGGGSTSFDNETITLLETGFDTGVFEGLIGSRAGSPQGNGVLDGVTGSTIEAQVFHLNDPGSTIARATFTGNAVLFIDEAGQPASVYLESSRVYVRVIDSFANGNPSSVDSTSVDITAEIAGDLERIILTETGLNTGVFEGSIAMSSGGGQQFNGFLETGQESGPPHQFDTLRATYNEPSGTSTATARTTGSRTWFVDAFGTVVDSYAKDSTVYVRVEDHNFNTDPARFDTASVRLTSQSPGDEEFLQLLETGKDTGIFEGSIRLASSGSGSDARLQASVGSQIDAEHPNAGPFGTFTTAQAVIEFLSLQFIDEAGRPTSEVLENGTARLRVVNVDGNSDPGTTNTLDVEVTSRFAGDREFAQLTETGADTGLFEGTIDLNFAPGSQANGILETFNSGPPEFRPEELTARVGPYSATAHTVAARLVFIDEFGREAVTVPLGSAVRVRLVDQTRNEPQARQSIQLDIRVVIANGGGSTSFDNETITLLETGFDTGVFEGLIGSRAGSPQGNGVLDGVTGSTIEAQVFHLNNPGSTVARATFTGNAVLFIDEAGQPASVYLESSRVYVRVYDSFANNNPSSADSTVVEVRSEISGDQETLNLIETGANTGVFEGSIKMRTGGGQQFNGFLETSQESGPPHQFDTLRVTHNEPSGTSTATARTTGSRTWFVDAFGTVVDSYAKDSTVYVRVEDHNFNTDPARFDTASVRLTSQSPGDEEFLQLLETGLDTGIFEGSIRLASSGSGSDGRLQASVGSRIDVEHPNAGPFGTFTTAQAVINFLSIQFIDDAGRPTSKVVENGTARVRVFSADDNSDPGSAETVEVEMTSRFAGDREFAQLTETGPDTDVFEGTIELNFGPGTQANAILETLSSGPPEFLPEELTARVGPYEATARTTGSRVVYLNLRGQVVTTYSQRSTVRVRIEDHNRNQSGVPDSFDIEVRSLTTNDRETVTLNETGPDSGIFEGSVPSSEQPGGFGDGTLSVMSGQVVEVEHVNTNSPTTVVARATFVANQVPVAADDLAETEEDQPVVIDVRANDSDPDSGPASVASVTQGSGGSVTINPDQTVTYSPAAGFTGTDTFTYIAVDDQGGEAVATVTVTVIPGNEAPTPADDQATTPEDQPVVLSVLANDTDPDGDPLHVVAVTQPAAGGAAAINPDDTITFTPAADFFGTGVAFTYTVRDPEGLEATANVTLTVTPVNDAPVAVDDTATTTEDTPVTIDIVGNDTDVDSTSLFPVAVTQPANGTTVLNPGSVTYTPAANFTGTDTFTYTVSDGNGGTDIATVTVTVTAVNDSPVANADTATVAEDSSVNVTVLANDTDPENDTLNVTAVTQGTNGTVVINPDKTVKYKPAANYSGSDTFTYTISDGNGGSATATVTVTVTGVNDSPVANADTATVAEDGSVNVTVLANDTDPENDTLSVTSVTQGAHGAVAINPDKTVKYTPAANYSGSDTFTYTISDGNGGTATASVNVTVTAVNDSPVANADTATVGEDGSINVTVLANDSDPENNTLSVTGITQGAHGSVSINPDKTVKYSPAANYNGSDLFTYTIGDGNGGTATATVSVTVTAVNDAPVAVNDTATVTAGTAGTISVLANDVDVDGPGKTVTSVTQGAKGSVAISGGGQTVTYTAGLFAGTDTFTYTVSDGAGGTSTATVTVTLAAPPRIGTGIQALYNFEEGAGSTILDVSGVGTPLNLTINSTSTVSWISGGLSINSATLVQSAANATKVINAAKASNTVTVEAWIVPDNLTQTGPARIMSIAKNSSQRNFFLGQAANRYEARLRTSSGTSTLQSPVASVTLNLVHLVYTRSSTGQAVVYVNGTQVSSQATPGNFSSWATDQKLTLVENATGNQAWRGDFYLMAIFGRALSANEVTQNFLAGPGRI